MKKRSILFIAIAWIAAAVLPSCQKEGNGVFDQSATERLEAMQNEVKTILTGESNGWLMKYYIGSSQSGGGYTYTIKFNNDEAEIGFELAKAVFGYDMDKTITSLYKISDDNGLVLSFDTYNDYIHYFATPSSSYYQAHGGDFEFEIRNVSPDKIEMIGRRSRNVITLEPLEKPVSEYIAEVVNTANTFIPYYLNGKVGSVDVTGTVDYSNRQIQITSEDRTTTRAFCFTDKGISLYSPLTIDGVSVQEMSYSGDDMKLVAEAVEIQGSVPSDWIPYSDYEGTYELLYAGGFTASVNLVPEIHNSTYKLTGLNSNFDLVLKYNMQTGKLVLNSQMVGTAEGYSIYFCAWALEAGGSVTWATNAGMQTVWNGDKENPVYSFESNGYVWRTAAGNKCWTDSFILFAIGDDIYYFDRASWGTNGYAQWPNMESLTKK